MLGEQRPTAIRGSRMEEAIFGGTEERRPIHRAEVTLELSNEDGVLAVPYSEVSIGRTVHRGGESEYTLNGTACRLRDILDLCRDTGLGSNAYAMIEARMIDAILSDRAEERRSLFEEAAEVGRYKDRRRIATRRLEQAEADLQRLDDVLIEIQSKVRSLAQQRGRAERHGTLRNRLLQLEVAAADALLERTEQRLCEARQELVALTQTGPSQMVDLQTSETELETLRIEFSEMEGERADMARLLEEARRGVEAQERALLLAQERMAAARDRLTAMAEEERQIEARSAGLQVGLDEAQRTLTGAEKVHDQNTVVEEDLRRVAEEFLLTSQSAIARRDTVREEVETARRELDRWSLELDTSEERARHRSEELERRRPALEALAKHELELKRLIAEASKIEVSAGKRLSMLTNELRDVRATVDETDETLREMRVEAARLEGRLSTAQAQASSLGALVNSSAMLPEILVELLEDREAVSGLDGVLSDYIEVTSEWASAVESHLGPYLHGLVVRDWDTVTRVQDWLEAHGGAEGILVLPRDPGPWFDAIDSAESSLLEKVEVAGPGATWATALLTNVEALENSTFSPRDHPWVGPDCRRQDRWGAVFIGCPGTGAGVLSRRTELQIRREEVADLEVLRDEQLKEIEVFEKRSEVERQSLEGLESTVTEVSAEIREAEADHASALSRLQRLDDERRELAGQIQEIEALQESESQRSGTGGERTRELEAAVQETKVVLTSAQSEADKARHAADTKRTEFHEAQLERTRFEADLSNRRQVMDQIAEALEDARARTRVLSEEREMLNRQLIENQSVTEEAEEATVSGLRERAESESLLVTLEGKISESREFMREREAELKNVRQLERERIEVRHALELEITQLEAAEAGVRGRLEAEWDTSLEDLREQAEPIEDGDPDAWEDELDQVRRSIARIGPVNLLAQQEYEEEKTRLEFLTEQREDLLEARDDLKDSIGRINKHAADEFNNTFEQVRENFHRTFDALFEGGECDVWLEDSEDPLDSPIEISASPRGKKTQRIHLLSGGERALTALALLFAIYLAKPSPFCLLDEVDAPLDETNILRFVRMLEEFKEDTQFIVITHNPRTMEGADWIYGVTMQEVGVSSIVGVEFDEAPQVA